MKQLIVLLATVILGLAIAGMVISLRTPARTMTDNLNNEMQSVLTRPAITLTN